MNKSKIKLKTLVLAGVAAAAFGAAATNLLPATSPFALVTPAEAQARLTVGFFFESLAPHGRWVRHRDHGFVWVPRGVAADWRPYTVGRWVHTADYGWYWASDEPFGWAVYHYGRWGYSPAFGWYWVPGTVWAPAWVVWRVGTDAIGWAPVAPERRGFAFGTPARFRPPVVESWVFVETRFVGARTLSQHIVPIREIPIYLERAPQRVTVNIQNNIVINQPIEITQIQQVLVEPMQTVQEIRFAQSPDQVVTAQADAQAITVFQAPIEEAAVEETPPDFVEEPEQLEEAPRLAETLPQAPPEADAPTAQQIEAGEAVEPLEEAEAPVAAPAEQPAPAPAADPAAPPVEAETEAEVEAEIDVEAEAETEVEAETEATPTTAPQEPPAAPAQPQPETAPAQEPAPVQDPVRAPEPAPAQEPAPRQEPAPAQEPAQEPAPAQASDPAQEPAPEPPAAEPTAPPAQEAPTEPPAAAQEPAPPAQEREAPPAAEEPAEPLEGAEETQGERERRR